MSGRRASTRISADKESTEQESGEMINGKRKGAAAEEVVFNAGDATKRRRKEGKRQPAFKPQPILNSSDTPPDEEIDLPPPPSERKIARRRDSTRVIRERAASNSPSRDQSSKRQKVNNSSTSTTNDGSAPAIDFLTFASSSRPKPSAPRPSSPPKNFSSSSRSAAPGGSLTMGPPTGFVRKTRKSMRGLGIFDDVSNESVVPVPENETPMIRKNRELREAQQRRSSLGLRGQRASSSFGRGEISIPHSSVDTSIFYKHIAPTMPEPIRARHLVAWCAKRALDKEVESKSRSKGKEKEKKRDGRTEEGDRVVKEIMEEFIGSLGRGAVDTNVFAQPGSVPGMHLRAHPRNLANREIEKKEETIIKRCKEENNQWSSIMRRANRKQAEMIDYLKEKSARNAEPDLSKTPWMTDAMSLAERIISEGEGDMRDRGQFNDVEFKIDSLHQTTHVALQYSQQAQRFLDGIFSSLTADLRSRERSGIPPLIPTDTENGPDTIASLSNTRLASTASSSTTAKKSDPMSLLRALASADLRANNDEAIAAAARVPPVQASTLNSLNVSVGPGVGATPRRVVGATPRRIGQHVISGATPRSVVTKSSE